LTTFSPDAIRTAAAIARVRLAKQREARASQAAREAAQEAAVARNVPQSPSALAKRLQPTKWDDTLPHTQLIDQVLVYLERRQAPVWWIRRYMREQDPVTRELVPVVLEGYDDDEEAPFTRAIVEAPPRHGKSDLCSRFFPAWYEGRHPNHRLMLTSYAAHLTYGWSRRARDIIASWGRELFGRGLGAARAADNWEMEGGEGGVYASGIRGAQTGRGANGLVVDDPVKDSKEAQSETLQDSNWDWFRSVALTRLEVDEDGLPPFVLVIMARWNEKDLVGKLLEQDAESNDPEDHYYVLNLPALAEANDPLGRAEGEALWPGKYPRERLERLRARIGTYFFSALYQGRPTPAGGGMFKREWWQRYRVMPTKARRGGIFIDTATDDKSTGDPFAMATIRQRGLDFFWERAMHQQLAFPDQIRVVLDAREASRSPVTPAGLPIYIEETPWALPLIKALKKLVTRVIGVKTGGVSKIARAMAGTPYVEAGNCYLPENASWVADFIEEHAAGPSAGWHDDYVDTTSLGLNIMGNRAKPEDTGPVSTALEYVAKADEPKPRTPIAREKARQQQVKREQRVQRAIDRRIDRPQGQRRRGGV
jgi:predicted phage terminase large subunit-like protein